MAPRARVLRVLSAVLVVTSSLLGAAVTPAAADIPAGEWAPRGVFATARTPEATYVSTLVPEVRRPTGGLVGVSRGGQGTLDPGLPRVVGLVSSVESDGAGGWFVGGNLRYVGGVRRHHLAHIRADGTVDPGFAPFPAGPVTALARRGTTVYAATSPDDDVAVVQAFETGSGSASPDWRPAVTGRTSAIVAVGEDLFLAGSLRGTPTEDPRGVVRVDARTGAERSWGARPFDAHALAVSDDTVYVGGSGILPREDGRSIVAAAFDRESGARRRWDPRLTGDFASVTSIDVVGDTVYVAGGFTEAEGEERDGLAAVDAATGALRPWAPPVGGTVRRVRADGDRVYVAGELRTTTDDRRYADIMSVDRDTGDVLSWDPGVAGQVASIVPSGQRVLVAGAFESAGPPLARLGNILRVLPDGTLDTDWIGPEILFIAGQGPIDAMTVAGDTLYAMGGRFVVDGRTRSGIVAIDLRTGRPRDFDPDVRGSVTHAVAIGDRLYLAGRFGSVGGLDNRRGLAAVDRTTGALLPWNPDPDDWIDRATSIGTRLYVTGDFYFVGGVPRRHLAAFDLTTGDLDRTFDPTAVASVNALEATADRLYVAGTIERPGRGDGVDIGVLDAATGRLSGWEPKIDDGAVLSISADGDDVWVSGNFRHVDGRSRLGVARVGATDAALRPTPELGLVGSDLFAVHIDAVGGRVVLSGYGLSGVGDRVAPDFAVIEPGGGGPATDDRRPMVEVTSPAEGEHVAQGSDRKVRFTCRDAVEGRQVPVCRGPERLRTEDAGPRSLTVVGEDRDGDRTEVVVRYVVDPQDPPTSTAPTDPPTSTGPTDPPTPTGPTDPPTTTEPTSPPTGTVPAPSTSPGGGGPPTATDEGGRGAEPNGAGAGNGTPPWLAGLFAPPPPAVPSSPSGSSARPSGAVRRATLTSVARSSVAALRRLRGRSASGFTTARSLAAGGLEVEVVTARGRRSLVARGAATRTSAGPFRVVLRSGVAGHRVLRSAGTLRVRVTVRHHDRSGTVTSATVGVTVPRR